jgi:hypothetical protein
MAWIEAEMAFAVSPLRAENPLSRVADNDTSDVMSLAIPKGRMFQKHR